MAGASNTKANTETNNSSDNETQPKNPWWKQARERAEKQLESPEKLSDFVDEASKKADQKKEGPLKKVWDSLSAMFRLVKAYTNGKYREVPWQSLVMIVGVLVYFVMPTDLLPDFIVGLGYIDDVTVIGWTLKTVADDINSFLAWETEQEKKS